MTTKPAPKSKPDNTYLRLTPELREQLATLCAKEDRTLSSMIRVLLGEAIERRHLDADLAARLERDRIEQGQRV